jgi:hypothetical protein
LSEAIERNPIDLDIPTLLLSHKASINHRDGKAVQIAAVTGSIEVLDLLLSYSPLQSILDKAFVAALSSNLDPGIKRCVFEKLLRAGVSS